MKKKENRYLKASEIFFSRTKVIVSDWDITIVAIAIGTKQEIVWERVIPHSSQIDYDNTPIDYAKKLMAVLDDKIYFNPEPENSPYKVIYTKDEFVKDVNNGKLFIEKKQ